MKTSKRLVWSLYRGVWPMVQLEETIIRINTLQSEPQKHCRRKTHKTYRFPVRGELCSSLCLFFSSSARNNLCFISYNLKKLNSQQPWKQIRRHAHSGLSLWRTGGRKRVSFSVLVEILLPQTTDWGEGERESVVTHAYLTSLHQTKQLLNSDTYRDLTRLRSQRVKYSS